VLEEGGFEDPYLDKASRPNFDFGKDPSTPLQPNTYEINLVGRRDPDIEPDVGGFYRPLQANIDVAVTTQNGKIRDLASILRTSRHELTHAYQYDKLGTPPGFGGPNTGVIEGGATLAEITASRKSGLVSRNTDKRLRPVEHGLITEGKSDDGLPEEIAYRTQDFWAFLHKELGVDYSLTSRVLNRVKETGGVRRQWYSEMDDVLKNQESSLREAYWAWAKSQAYEGGVIASNDDCESDLPEPDKTHHPIPSDGSLVDLNPYGSDEPSTTPPFGSEWMTVTVFNPTSGSGINQVDISMNVQSSRGETDGLRAKIYRPGSGNCSSDKNSGLRKTIGRVQLEADGSELLKVIVANATMFEYDLSVGFEAVPSAPAGLQTSSSRGQVGLSWGMSNAEVNARAGAGSESNGSRNKPVKCNIYRSTSQFESQNEASLVGTVGTENNPCYSDPSFVDDGVQNSTTYYYRVSGVYGEAEIESALSEATQATPLPGPPGRP
jgi:hypothetical protein